MIYFYTCYISPNDNEKYDYILSTIFPSNSLSLCISLITAYYKFCFLTLISISLFLPRLNLKFDGALYPSNMSPTLMTLFLHKCRVYTITRCKDVFLQSFHPPAQLYILYQNLFFTSFSHW